MINTINMSRRIGYIICAFLNILICFFLFIAWSGGSHGYMKFNVHKLEDLLFLAINLPWILLSIVFTYKAVKKEKL